MRLSRTTAVTALTAGVGVEALAMWVLIGRPAGWSPILGVLFAAIGLVGIAAGFASLAGNALAHRMDRIALDAHIPGYPPPTRSMMIAGVAPVVIWGILWIGFLVAALQRGGVLWLPFAFFLLLFAFRIWIVVLMVRARRRAAATVPPPPD